MKKTLCFLLMVALALTGASALAEEERTTIEIFMQIPTEFDPDTSPIVPARGGSVRCEFRIHLAAH